MGMDKRCKVIVTGGAGFIGSCIVRTLNDMGIEDIVIVDNICKTDKWLNIRNKKYREYINRDEFLARLPEYSDKVSHVIHMGACSSTTERNFDFLYKNNFGYTKTLWRFCIANNISFLYASSAATYGDGRQGFNDKADIRGLLPLNAYGYSKHLFDLWAEEQTFTPKQHVGFKFFNVYGPNEYCKGSMASMVYHSVRQISIGGGVKLFKSYRDDYKDGEQLRDFVYVKDICKAVQYVMENPQINGLYNLGTGKARSFYDLALAVFRAMGLAERIQWIDMPEQLRETYQYYTQAEMDKFRETGFQEEFYSLEDGVADYVQNYLLKGFRVY